MRGSPGLLTDHYELTMVGAALRDGTAERRCVFEVFARRLPPGRRYGVVAGIGRLLDLLRNFRFDRDEIEYLVGQRVVDDQTAQWLERFQFRGELWGTRKGNCSFPTAP